MTPRELDALVAEKVMGLPVLGEHHGEGDYVFQNGVGDLVGYQSVPHYSTSIAAAMEIVSKMGRWHGFDFVAMFIEDLWDKSKPPSWEAGWYEQSHDGYEARTAANSDVLAKAICLAALKAVGVEVPHE